MTSRLHAAVARELIAERHRQAADARRHPASTKTNRWPGPLRRRPTGWSGRPEVNTPDPATRKSPKGSSAPIVRPAPTLRSGMTRDPPDLCRAG
jgi:hypothetical protein